MKRQSGFTLMEILIATGLVLMLIALATDGLVLGQKRSRAVLDVSSWLQTHAILRLRLESDLESLTIPPGRWAARVADSGRSLAFYSTPELPEGPLQALTPRKVVYRAVRSGAEGFLLTRNGKPLLPDLLEDVAFDVRLRERTYWITANISLSSPPSPGQPRRRHSFRVMRVYDIPAVLPGLESPLAL